MSVSHVFSDFRFIFVKCSCSRRDGTSLFSLFYKIILYIQGSRLRPKCDHFLRASKVVALVLVHGLRCSKARALPAAAHCSRRKISLIRCERFSRAWIHTARVSRAEQRQHRAAHMQSGSSARPLCFHSPRQHEHSMEDLVFKLK